MKVEEEILGDTGITSLEKELQKSLFSLLQTILNIKS